MMVAKGPLCDNEIAQRIKDVTEAVPCPRDVVASDDLDFVFLIPRHPAMRLDAGFVEFVSPIWFPPFDPLTP
jgi:hypothetical protein